MLPSCAGNIYTCIMLPSCAGSNYYIIMNVNQIHHLHYHVLFQNNPGQVNICSFILYFLHSNAQMLLVRIYSEPYVDKFCTVNVFFNITRRKAISQVAKFLHLIGCGSMIQRVILILSNFAISKNLLHANFTLRNTVHPETFRT